jgi:hypothetical protein
MTIQTTTHLNFRGDARQALEFYQSVFGGNAVINTYADFGMPAGVPGADKVVFGLVAADNGFRLMAYDIPGQAEGSLAGGGSTRARTTPPSPIRRFLSPWARTRSMNCRAIGMVSPSAPPSLSRWPHLRGAPVSACSPTVSGSPGASASPQPEPCSAARVLPTRAAASHARCGTPRSTPARTRPHPGPSPLGGRST